MRQNYQISEHFPSSDEEEVLEFPIFARKEYWLLHLPEDQILPLAIRDENKRLISFWCFFKNQFKLRTPFQAPFFTPYFAENVNKTLIIFKLINYCKEKYCIPQEFTLIGDAYLRNPIWDNSLCKVKDVAISTRLIVSEKSFHEQINRNRKRRKLKSLLQDKNYQVSQVQGSSWREVYLQNIRWRKIKMHENMMTAEEMQIAKNAFPDVYHSFQIMFKGQLVGSAFFLYLDKNLVYVYSLIIDSNFDLNEPSLLLWNAIYEWAKSKKVIRIEMGTSMNLKGGINKKLARYKAYIGGQTYRRYTFQC